MSYEGYVQNLCANGHLFELDAHNACYMGQYTGEDGRVECPVCKADVAWSNQVDLTNDAGFPYIDFRAKSEVVVDTCDKCGHSEVKALPTYHIPSTEEMEQYHRDEAEYYSRLYGAPEGSDY